MITGIDSAGGLWSLGENWGSRTDIAAPATSLVALDSSGALDTISGNSYASAFVGGVAAQLRAMDATPTGAQVRDYIVRGAQTQRMVILLHLHTPSGEFVTMLTVDTTGTVLSSVTTSRQPEE